MGCVLATKQATLNPGGRGGYAMWQYFFFVPLDRTFRLPGAEHPYRLCEDMVLECISNGRLFQARVSAGIASKYYKCTARAFVD